MGWFRFAPATPREPSVDALIRVFQSETAEIREDPEPAQLRLTLPALAGFFVALLAVTAVMPMDRVVTSSAGQIVTSEPTIVLQALDPSIIKTLDVREGELVKSGQLLATLDPTFTTADVSALTMQIASLEAQIARSEAELGRRDFAPPLGSTAQAAYAALQKAYYLQRKGQFEAQLRAYEEQIAQNRATIRKLTDDLAHYDDRVKVSQEIEKMRASLAASQVGSRLNLLIATDQRLGALRSLDSDRNGLVERAPAGRDDRQPRRLLPAMAAQVSQELVTAKNAPRQRPRAAGKGSAAPGIWCAWRRRTTPSFSSLQSSPSARC
jgi:HlyD family secretion protein